MKSEVWYGAVCYNGSFVWRLWYCRLVTLIGVLTCFCVFAYVLYHKQEKNNEDSQLTTRLETAKEQAKSLCGALLNLQEEKGIDMSTLGGRGEGIAASLNFGLAAPVYEWARGMPFEEITGRRGVMAIYCDPLYMVLYDLFLLSV